MAWVDRMNFGQASFWGTVDADPTAAAGLVAPAGSFAILDTGRGQYLKVGAADLAWIPLGIAQVLTLVPGINEDVDDGYAVGSLVTDNAAPPGLTYVCRDNTAGAAVWSEITGLHAEAAAPLVTDDDDAGYNIGDAWYSTTLGLGYACTDNTTGAAVWEAVFAGETSDYALNGTFRATFDFAVHGGVAGAIPFGAFLPANAWVTEAFYEVLTTFASPTGPDNATIEVGHADDAPGLVIAAAINVGTAFDDTGVVIVTIADQVPANFMVKTTVARQIQITVGVEDITAGSMCVFGSYAVTGA